MEDANLLQITVHLQEGNKSHYRLPQMENKEFSLLYPQQRDRKRKQSSGISFPSGVVHQSVTAVVSAGCGSVTHGVDLQNTQPVDLLEFNASKL